MNYHQENLTFIKEQTVLYIYLGSASAGIDDWQSSDIEKNDWLGHQVLSE